ncbi:hypothetical protein Hanom_Chr06g00495831 [Helianthus anomalus]
MVLITYSLLHIVSIIFAATAWLVTVGIVGIGREIRSAAMLLKSPPGDGGR